MKFAAGHPILFFVVSLLGVPALTLGWLLGDAWLAARHQAAPVAIGASDKSEPAVLPLGICQQTVQLRPHSVQLIGCALDLPVAPGRGDFVSAKVMPGLAGYSTRLYGTDYQTADDGKRYLVVYFFIENRSAGNETTLTSASAVLYRMPKIKTPAVAAAGVDSWPNP